MAEILLTVVLNKYQKFKFKEYFISKISCWEWNPRIFSALLRLLF